MEKDNKETIDISSPPQSMTEAMHRHFVTKENVAVVDDNICIRGGVPCMYALHKKKGEKNSPPYETCEFKNKMDDFLYGALKSGLVLHLTIDHCDHYQPENDISTIAQQMQTVRVE